MRRPGLTRWDYWLGGAAVAAVLGTGFLYLLVEGLSGAERVGAALLACAVVLAIVGEPRLRWRLMRVFRSLGDRIGVGEPVKLALPWVIDGDTIDDLATGRRYRLANIDAPETGDNAKCFNERQLGERAKREAIRLVCGASSVAVRKTWRLDRYGRVVAYVEIDGVDLGETLAMRGFARRWDGRRRPWCGPQGPLAEAAKVRGEWVACTACSHWRPRRGLFS